MGWPPCPPTALHAKGRPGLTALRPPHTSKPTPGTELDPAMVRVSLSPIEPRACGLRLD